MHNSLQDKKIARTLDRLYKDMGEWRETAHTIKILLRRIWGSRPNGEELATAYLAIPRDKGELLYTLLRSSGARHVVEFGMSFGISTLYLAAGARDNGGTVITTEKVAVKCEAAANHFKEAGVSEIVKILKGDALETLKTVTKPIEFLFLDGWKDIYLPIVEMLEPRFKKGTMIVADNAKMRDVAPYLDYIRMHPEKYATCFIDKRFGGMEVSCYIGD
ncbi:hypothetical protein COTS27_00154 [Spirochaetota bacterium]|nr:hypothetical protein COTS27_00154 [Spirochaetota bacterium]